MASTRRIRRWSGVSLSPDTSLGLPGFEEPGPEVPRAAEVAQQARPQITDRARRQEEEDVVRFRLPHELADEIGACLRVGILEASLELLQRQLAVPKEVGTALVIREALARSRAQHCVRLADSQGCRRQPGKAHAV